VAAGCALRSDLHLSADLFAPDLGRTQLPDRVIERIRRRSLAAGGMTIQHAYAQGVAKAMGIDIRNIVVVTDECTTLSSMIGAGVSWRKSWWRASWRVMSRKDSPVIT
jgi:hypothetical protein